MTPPAPMRLAAVDLGSNSFHLLVVDAHPDGSFDVLLRDKEMLRLGEVVARTGAIPPETIERIVSTLRRFAIAATSIGAVEVVACATSALREAENSAAIVDLVREETGIEIEVISGRREAALIFSAVRESVDLEPGPAVCFDLGGGSMEVTVGDHRGLAWSTSVHLGAARLATQFLTEDPPSAADLERLEARILEVLAPVAEEVRAHAPRQLVGTSGTFLDLARMAAAARTGRPPQSVNQLVTTRAELADIHEKLLALPARGRAKLAGLDARRADQIPVGSLVLLTILRLFGFEELVVGEWALREGIVLDAIRRHDVAEWTNDGEAIRRVVGARTGPSVQRRRDPRRPGGSPGDDPVRPHRRTARSRPRRPRAPRARRRPARHRRARGRGEPPQAHRLPHRARAATRLLARGCRCAGDARSLPPPQRPQGLVRALRPPGAGATRGDSPPPRAVAPGRRARSRPCRRRHGRRRRGDRRARACLLVLSATDMDLELWGVRRKRELFERLFGRRVEVVAADHPSVATRSGW